MAWEWHNRRRGLHGAFAPEPGMRIRIRVTEEQHDRIKRSAMLAGMTMSEYVVCLCEIAWGWQRDTIGPAEGRPEAVQRALETRQANTAAAEAYYRQLTEGLRRFHDERKADT